MIRLFVLLSIFSLSLWSGELHLTLQSVSKDVESGQIKTARVEPGVSGFVIRHFTPEHSAIIANAVVTDYDEAAGILDVAFTDYEGLRQGSLPKGMWQPEAGDEVVLAFAYSRGVLIAPTRDIYRKLTDKIKSVDWMHPDTLATYLSYEGHPTPLKKDLAGFCSVATTGLLFIYVDDALFTLDCQSLSVLQIAEAGLAYQKAQRPFYTRVEKIHANWFGAGSSTIDDYNAYYLQLMVENNPRSKRLYDYLQSHPSTDKQLLDEFDLKAQP